MLQKYAMVEKEHTQRIKSVSYRYIWFYNKLRGMDIMKVSGVSDLKQKHTLKCKYYATDHVRLIK